PETSLTLGSNGILFANFFGPARKIIEPFQVRSQLIKHSLNLAVCLPILTNNKTAMNKAEVSLTSMNPPRVVPSGVDQHIRQCFRVLNIKIFEIINPNFEIVIGRSFRRDYQDSILDEIP